MKHLVSSLLNKIWRQKEKSDTCFKLPRLFCFKRESPNLFKLLQLLQRVKKLTVYLLLLQMVKSLTLSSFHRNPHFLFLLDFFYRTCFIQKSSFLNLLVGYSFSPVNFLRIFSRSKEPMMLFSQFALLSLVQRSFHGHASTKDFSMLTVLISQEIHIQRACSC